MLRFESTIRNDAAGSGHFGAPRGSRKHNGIDILAEPGLLLLSPVAGKVTKLGYPYAGDMHYRYIEVTSNKGLKHRFFYVSPEILLKQIVVVGQLLGVVQDVKAKYPTLPAMRNHVHYEVMQLEMDGYKYVDPVRARETELYGEDIHRS